MKDNKIIPGKNFTYTGMGIFHPNLFLKHSDKELGIILNKEENIGAEIYSGMWNDIGTPDRLNEARKSISL